MFSPSYILMSLNLPLRLSDLTLKRCVSSINDVKRIPHLICGITTLDVIKIKIIKGKGNLQHCLVVLFYFIFKSLVFRALKWSICLVVMVDCAWPPRPPRCSFIRLFRTRIFSLLRFGTSILDILIFFF